MQLARVLRPSSIAVVGASPKSFAGSVVLHNCERLGFGGRVWPVNPKYSDVAGSPCFASLADLPQVPDVVVALVGARGVAAVAEQAAELGVAAVVVPGAGTTDSGAAAGQVGAQLRRLADETGLACVGPNCMGVLDLVTGAAPYIGTVPAHVRRGSVAVVAQSGAVVEAFVNCGGRIGFSSLVSAGSEASLSAADYLQYFARDPETAAVLAFVEGFVDPDRLLASARALAEAGKPLVVCTVGRSVRGRAGVAAHSGRLAPAARVAAAALRQAGAVLVDDLDQLLAAGEIVAGGRRPRGNRLHVVTNSGGEASLLADLAEDHGLELPPLSAAAVDGLTARWPDFHVANPMDPWGVAEYTDVYPPAIAVAAAEPGDVVVVCQDQQQTSGEHERALGIDLAGYLGTALAGGSKLGVLLQPDQPGPGPWSSPSTAADPAWCCCGGATTAMTVLGRLTQAGGPATPVTGPARTSHPLLDAGEPLAETAALAVLGDLGVPVPKVIKVGTPAEAVAAAAELGGAVVVKAEASGLVHKTELGLVRPGLQGPEQVRAAADAVLDAARAADIECTLLVAEMVRGDLEVVVGYLRDPHFGPTVLVGLGGCGPRRWTPSLCTSGPSTCPPRSGSSPPVSSAGSSNT